MCNIYFTFDEVAGMDKSCIRPTNFDCAAAGRLNGMFAASKASLRSIDTVCVCVSTCSAPRITLNDWTITTLDCAMRAHEQSNSLWMNNNNNKRSRQLCRLSGNDRPPNTVDLKRKTVISSTTCICLVDGTLVRWTRQPWQVKYWTKSAFTLIARSLYHTSNKNNNKRVVISILSFVSLHKLRFLSLRSYSPVTASGEAMRAVSVSFLCIFFLRTFCTHTNLVIER